VSIRLENNSDIRELVLMSIGTNKVSWWADGDFGSELYLLRASSKVDGDTAGSLKRMIEGCLAWLIADGIAKDILVSASRSGKNRIEYTVEVRRPNGNNFLVKDVWDV